MAVTVRVREAFKRMRWACVPLGLVAFAFFLFPGRRLPIAFTIGTGIGRDALQARIDEVEATAIRGSPLPPDDRELLLAFYRSLATGGRLSVLVRQTGQLMDHYLDGSGAPFELEPAIFTENRKVQAQMRRLREQSIRAGCTPNARFSSPPFYMPDDSKLDSVFGLYHGTLHALASRRRDGSCQLRFRAEVPWVWPDYPSLARKYGDPHAESFPLPSLRSLLFGEAECLFVDNGLGHYLEEVQLAKSFLAYAEWSDD